MQTGDVLSFATDAGIPAASGQATSFRVSQLNPQGCEVMIDGPVIR